MGTTLVLNRTEFAGRRSEELMPQLLKHLPLLAFVWLTSLSAGASVSVKSYREWKTEKVSQASVRVASVKNQLDNKKAVGVDPNLAMNRSKHQLEGTPGKDLAAEKLERMLRAEQYDLELARDLSVTDYFVGYLIKVQDKKAAFQEVAGKLSPEEVAELMTAYANSVFGAHQTDLPVSALNHSKEVK